MTFQMSEAQKGLRRRARELAAEVISPRAADVDRTEEYPWANVEALREAGFCGMTVPPVLGGPGHGIFETVLVIDEIARACGVSARIVVESNLGAISTILEYGTEEQRELAARLVLEGDKPAICITEPEAGSAAGDMTTRADRRGNCYVLNGHKHWITGGGVSRLYLIFARVFAEDGTEEGIGAFIALPEESNGLRIGRREPTMGLRGIPETEVFCEDLEVPANRCVVPPGGFGRGFARLLDAYNTQRVGAAAVALGLAQGAFERGRDFVLQREQFGRPIAEFQGLQWMLADMSVQLAAARSLVHGAARSADPFPDRLAAAQAKVFTSEMAIGVTNDALQLFGARGYSRDCPMERIARDARMFTIGGGTAQVLRNLIASEVLGRKLPQTK